MAIDGNDITELYELHAQAILKFAMRRTLDPQLSLDVVGETFAVAFERRRKYRGSTDAEASSWLFGIADNLIKMYFRSGAIDRRAMSRLGVDRTIVSDEEIERIEALAGTSELRAAVRDALADLGNDQRAAVRLRVVEELDYPEVAQRLAVSEQVARARVSRGLKSLRDSLGVVQLEEVTQDV